MVQNQITAEDYVNAFKTGVLPDGTLLNKKAERSTDAEQFKRVNQHIAVSSKVKHFIITTILSSPTGLRTGTEIGRLAYHTPDIARNHLKEEEEHPKSRYSAWGGEYCKRLVMQGLLCKKKIPLDNPPSFGRKTTVMYGVTDAGKRWLDEYAVFKIYKD